MLTSGVTYSRSPRRWLAGREQQPARDRGWLGNRHHICPATAVQPWWSQNWRVLPSGGLRFEGSDIRVHLGSQRLGQHPPGAPTDDLIDQRRRGIVSALAAQAVVSDYGEYWVVPSRPALHRRACLRPLLDHREGTHLPANPQVSSIAPRCHEMF